MTRLNTYSTLLSKNNKALEFLTIIVQDRLSCISSICHRVLKNSFTFVALVTNRVHLLLNPKKLAHIVTTLIKPPSSLSQFLFINLQHNHTPPTIVLFSIKNLIIFQELHSHQHKARQQKLHTTH